MKVSTPSALGGEEVVAEFAYDYAGRRVRHNSRFVFLGDGAGGAGDPVPSDTRFYFYDQQSCLVEYASDPALPTDSEALVKTRQYIFGNELISAESWIASDPSPAPKSQVPSPVANSQVLSTSPQSPGPKSLFYHQDALGSTVHLTGLGGSVQQAYLYDAWGNYRELDVTDPADPGDPLFDATPDLGPDGLYAWESYLAKVQGAWSPVSLLPSPDTSADWNRFTYTGHEFDPETGLYYFKARFYDPELGRFASEDPYLGDPTTPPSLHRYIYAHANPLLYVDLSGYFADKKIALTDGGETVLNSQVTASDCQIAPGCSRHPVDAILDRFEFTADEQAQFLRDLDRLNPGLKGEDGQWMSGVRFMDRDIRIPLNPAYQEKMKGGDFTRIAGNMPRLVRGEDSYGAKVLREMAHQPSAVVAEVAEGVAEVAVASAKELVVSAAMNSNPYTSALYGANMVMGLAENAKTTWEALAPGPGGLPTAENVQFWEAVRTMSPRAAGRVAGIGGVGIVTGMVAAELEMAAGPRLTTLGSIPAPIEINPMSVYERTGVIGIGPNRELYYPEGSFSVVNWSGYPEGLPQPTGVFRLLEGEEYLVARKIANSTNRALHKTDSSLVGKHIHEVKPVKFNGDPTDLQNKIPLAPQEHFLVTNWWNDLLRRSKTIAGGE